MTAQIYKDKTRCLTVMQHTRTHIETYMPTQVIHEDAGGRGVAQNLTLPQRVPRFPGSLHLKCTNSVLHNLTKTHINWRSAINTS